MGVREMTRDEAKKKINIQKREVYPYRIIDNVDSVIDEIFDSLEDTNCSNCKHTDDEYFDLFCINPDVINQHNHLFENGQSMYDSFKVSADFSCNKWKLKNED